MITMRFNGIELETALGGLGSFQVTEIEGRGTSRRTASMLEVPGRDGAYLRRVKTPPRELEVSVIVIASGLTNLRDMVDDLNAILITDSVVPIEFSDEQKTYYGFLSDTNDWSEILSYGMGTIQLTCPDPAKYGPEVSDVFTGDSLYMDVYGNTETKPRFESTVLKDTTHVDFVRPDGEYMRLGRVAQASDELYEKNTLLISDSGTSIAGWTVATETDDGQVAGTMGVEGGGFVATSFGTTVDPNSFQGPAIKRNTGAPLQQFKSEFLVENLNSGTEMGLVEIYLLNASNATVAKLSIRDQHRTTSYIEAVLDVGPPGTSRVRLGNYADNYTAWTNFDGMIRLTRERVEGVYRYWAYFGLIDSNGRHHTRANEVYHDTQGIFDDEVTQVQISIRKHPSFNESQMKVKDVKVWSINDVPEGVPLILSGGDQLVVDHKTEEILINGEPRKDLKDFGASFFSLKTGIHTLYQYPVNTLDTSVYWRSKYK